MYEWNLRDPYFKVWLRMRQVWEALERAMEMEMEPLPATLSQIDILMILRGSSIPLTPTQIASYIFRAQHSVSGLITRMERAGYVIFWLWKLALNAERRRKCTMMRR